MARSKRIELEQCLIVYSVLKQENAARESSKTNTPSTLRHRSTPGSSRSGAGGGGSNSSSGYRPTSRVMGELQDHEVVNLVRLLRELDGLSSDTSSRNNDTVGGSPVRDGPATLQELVTSGAAAPPPTAPRRINLDGTERTPPATPPRVPGSVESRRSAGGSATRHRHRHRTIGASAEGSANANTVRDVS